MGGGMIKILRVHDVVLLAVFLFGDALLTLRLVVSAIFCGFLDIKLKNSERYQ